MPVPTYIEPHELFELMQRSPSSVAVVDARDDDRTNWIVGSISYPSLSWTEKGWAELGARLEGVPIVVFHCMFSQVRGPKAAMRFASTFPNTQSQIRVLRGGFVGFKNAIGRAHPAAIQFPASDRDDE